MKLEPPWPDRVQCFVVTETNTTRVSLRRYTNSNQGWTCAEGWHSAAVNVAEEPNERVKDPHEHWRMLHGVEDFEGDPRWPATCEGCDYAFTPDDHWQVFEQALYRMPDGTLLANRDLPPGAMFDSWWYPDSWKRDGQALTVVLPDGTTWNMDGPATGGGHWTREGEPPNVTANPSIFSSPPDGYHGFLRSGWLERC